MTLTIRAAVASGLNQPLTIESVELRAPQAGEVLVQMKASGLCHTDLSVIQGGFPVPFPSILGHEGAGVVLECGPGVTRVKAGDRVLLHNSAQCGTCPLCLSEHTKYCEEMDRGRKATPAFSRNGKPLITMSKGATFATHTVLSEFYLSQIPDDMPFASASLIGCGVMTGIGAALNTAQVRKDSSVVVIGMGSIGLNAIQGARLAGARRIVAVDTNPAKEATARTFGATDFVNPKNIDEPLEVFIPKFLGTPADFSFECVGNTDLLRQCVTMTHPFWGVCIAVGVPPHTQKFEIPANAFYVGRRVQGTFIGDGKPQREAPRIISWYQQGEVRLDELVTHRITLDQINEGFEMMKRSEVIRSVIVYD